MEENIDIILDPALEIIQHMPNKVYTAAKILYKLILDKYPIINYKSNWGLVHILESNGLTIYTKKSSCIAFRGDIDYIYALGTDIFAS